MKGKWKTNKVFISTRWNEKKEAKKRGETKRTKMTDYNNNTNLGF